MKALPSLDYDTNRVYTLTVTCTDTKEQDTGTFNVYITRNNPPSITNLNNGGNEIYRHKYHHLSFLFCLDYGMYMKVLSSLNCDTNRVCILTVNCIDTKEHDTFYIIRNNLSRITNLNIGVNIMSRQLT